MFVSNTEKRAIQTEMDALVAELHVEWLLQNQWMRQIISGPTADYRLVGSEDVEGRRTLKYEFVSEQNERKSKTVIWMNVTSGLPVRSATYQIDAEGHETLTKIFQTVEANTPPPARLLSFDPPEGYQLAQAGAQPANFEIGSSGNGQHRSAMRYPFAIDRMAILVCWHHSVVGPGLGNGAPLNDPKVDQIEPIVELQHATGNRECYMHPIRTQIDEGQVWHWSLAVPVDRRLIKPDETIHLKFKYPKGTSSFENYPLRLDDDRLKIVINRWLDLGKETGDVRPDVTLVRLRWLASRLLMQGDAGDQQKIEQK